MAPTATSGTDTPRGPSDVATRSGERTSARTSWPDRTTAAAVWEPTYPVAPVTSTRMLVSPDIDEDLAHRVGLDGRVRVGGPFEWEADQRQSRFRAHAKRARCHSFLDVTDGLFLRGRRHRVDQDDLEARVRGHRWIDRDREIVVLARVDRFRPVPGDDRLVQRGVGDRSHLHDRIDALRGGGANGLRGPRLPIVHNVLRTRG